MVKHHLGSIRGWFLPNSETEMAVQQFTPYGTRVLIDSAFASPLPSYGWTGREYDAETGFYYLRARYYDPTELRFIQEDPSGYGGGPNVYAYVGGAVLSATDPSGMQASFGLQTQMEQWLHELAASESGIADADRRFDALDTWGDMSAAMLEEYARYKLYEQEFLDQQKQAESVGVAKILRDLWSGTEVSWGDYQTVYAFLGPNGNHDQTGFGTWVMSRFDGGDFVMNGKWVTENNPRLGDAFGLTQPEGTDGSYGVTALNGDMIHNAQQLIWAVGHETLHLWDEFAGGRLSWEIEGPINSMERGLVGFANPYQ